MGQMALPRHNMANDHTILDPTRCRTQTMRKLFCAHDVIGAVKEFFCCSGGIIGSIA